MLGLEKLAINQITTDAQCSLRDAIEEHGTPISAWLQDTVALVVPQLRGLRHGDGGLALFNGGFEVM